MLVLLVLCGLVVCDQATKFLANRHLTEEARTVIPGLFDLRFVRNTGAAWGMLEGFNDGLVALSAVMLALMLIWRRHFFDRQLTHRVAAGLMMGGIVGNLFDRLKMRYVIDFLDFHWGRHHFPAFNLADAGICVGVFLYLATHLLARRGGNEGGVSAAEAGGRGAEAES